MAGSPSPAESVRNKSGGSYVYVPNIYHAQQWAKFVRRCLRTRLDVERFAKFAPIQRRRHPVSPVILVDIFLRPSARTQPQLRISHSNVCEAPIDPRIPAYLKILLQLGYVDVISILQGLYRFSSSQAARREAAVAAAVIEEQSRTADTTTDGGNHSSSAGSKKDSASGAGSVIWGSSFYNEETMFYRIARAVRQENAIRGKKSALAAATTMAAWMQLFVAAASSFATAALVPTDLSEQAFRQDGMESCRTAFVLLLLAVLEDPVVLDTLRQPYAKAARRALSHTLPSFMPIVAHSSSVAVARLDHFYSGFLALFDQVKGEKEEASNNIHDLLDSTVGLQNLAIPELPISNSRAGLYIYLNAAVSLCSL